MLVTLVIGVLAGVIVTVIDSPGDSEFDKGKRLIILSVCVLRLI